MVLCFVVDVVYFGSAFFVHFVVDLCIRVLLFFLVVLVDGQKERGGGREGARSRPIAPATLCCLLVSIVVF